MELENKVMVIVNQMIRLDNDDSLSDNTRKNSILCLARKLLKLAGICEENTEIFEIPVMQDNQVVVLFFSKSENDDNYYSIFAGIGTDGKFYFEFSITGRVERLKDSYKFDFYDKALVTINVPIEN